MKLKIKKLDKLTDDRGWLAEILSDKDSDGKELGLVLITTAHPGKTKGNHYHKRKTEWYCVISGKGLLRVWNDSEKEEMELSSVDLALVEIPTGYFHSITNIGEEELHLLAIVSESFNEGDPDTYYE